MKKWRICRLVVILMLLIPEVAWQQSVTLLKKTHFTHFPSASALEFYDGRLFVFGDDARQLLILDREHSIKDSILLFKTSEKRIPKEQKADIEAATIVTYKNSEYLLALSSFSTPKRNRVFAFPLQDVHAFQQIKSTKVIPLLKATGIKEINIEGAATVNHYLLLTNRANYTYKENYLLKINLKEKDWMRKSPVSILISLPDQKGVTGLSGLAYLAEKDMLLFTASTEETTSAYTDGAIGDSYLGYITNISRKLKQSSIQPDQFINLSTALPIEKEKIESLCIERMEAGACILHLASDNDNGESKLYKIKLKL